MLRLFASIGRLHIVAIAALGTFTFGWLFTGHYPWAVTGICALDWFLVNLLNRVVDLREDRINQIVGTDFVGRHRTVLVVGGFTLLGLSLIATQLILPALTLLRLAYHALGFAYNWPLSPGFRRLKQLYFFKNSASALGFMITVFLYPLVAHRGPLVVSHAAILVTALYFFLFELSYEVIYDLRDAAGDARAEVRTYPVVHGPLAALQIIDGLLAAAAAVLTIGWAAKVVPWRIFILVCGPIVQAIWYRRAFRRGITARDCISMTWAGAGLLVAYHLWVVAGLPGVGV